MPSIVYSVVLEVFNNDNSQILGDAISRAIAEAIPFTEGVVVFSSMSNEPVATTQVKLPHASYGLPPTIKLKDVWVLRDL